MVIGVLLNNSSIAGSNDRAYISVGTIAQLYCILIKDFGHFIRGWSIAKYFTADNGCSSRNRDECPLHKKCLTLNIIYKEVVSPPS